MPGASGKSVGESGGGASIVAEAEKGKSGTSHREPMESLAGRNAALAVVSAMAHRLGKRRGDPCGAQSVRAAGGLDDVAYAAGVEAGRRLGWIVSGASDAVALTPAGRSAAGHAILWPSAARLAAMNLKGPTGAEFDPAAWKALVSDENAETEDRRLVATAEWLGTEAKALKDLFPGPPSAPGGPARATLFAAAAVNRDYANALSKDGGHQLFARNMLNQPVTLNDYSDAVGDTLKSWLVAASRAPISRARRPGRTDLTL